MSRHACCFALTFLFGVAMSSGMQSLMIPAVFFPVVAIVQPNRTVAFFVGGAYYLGASWPVILVTRDFQDPGGFSLGLLVWLVASTLLALPWLWVWSPSPRQSLWRVPTAMLCSAVPPLGVIGWAHPLTAAGLLFPGTGWVGLLAVLCLPGGLVCWPRSWTTLGTIATVSANLVASQVPGPPSGWEAFQTRLGDISRSSEAEFAAFREITEQIRLSPATVMVFPEGLIPRWSGSVSAAITREMLSAPKPPEALLLGAQIPDEDFAASVDFRDAMNVLEGRRTPTPISTTAHAYRNVVAVVDTRESRFFDQHVPVPIAMWKPFSRDGVRLNWRPNSPRSVVGHRICLLICYESLLVWPVLSAMPSRPTALVAVANDHWTAGTPISKVRKSIVSNWARLFSIPHLSASNR